MGGRAFKLSIVILFPGKFWNHLGQFLTPRSNNSESKSFSALELCCSHGACTAAIDSSLTFPAAFPGSSSVCRIAGAGHPQMSLVHLCSLITLCSENTMEKKSSSEHMVAFWKRMSACPVLQSGFYFLACLEKQAGLLSSGVFSKPLAVTFSLLMVLGQRCEGVGRVPLTGISGASSLCCFWAVSAPPWSSPDVSLKVRGCCRLGLCHEAAFLAVQGLLKYCFHMKGNPTIDVLLIKRGFVLLEKLSSCSFR